MFRAVAALPAAAVLVVPVLVVTLLLVTALAGCTVGPSTRPPVAVRGADQPAAPPSGPPAPGEPAPLQPQNPTLRFADCAATGDPAVAAVPPSLQVECAELPVPVDLAQPQLGGFLLGVVRVGPAGAPLDRPPLLALGDSTAGGSVAHALDLASRLSPAVLDRFTVIGVDRRGTGADLLDCAPAEDRAALVDADPAATGDVELAALLERARSVVQSCTLTPPGVPTAYGSAAAASDVEQLRVRLGVPQLSAVGTGDGAAVLAAWARSAPGAVGRLVLDGPPPPGASEPATTTERAAAAGAALTAFAAACTAPACPLGADPRATLTAAVDALRARPLAAPDGRRLTAGSAQLALLLGLSEPRGWAALATGFAAVAAGDPVPLLDLLDPVSGARGTFDAALATSCNDAPARLSPPEVSALAAELRAAQPLVGDRLALGLLACAPWPAVGAPDPGAGEGLPPLLVIGTAADPRTSLDGARRAAAELPSAAFLEWQGAGTGAYPRSPCVVRLTDALLLDGTVPSSSGICPP